MLSKQLPFFIYGTLLPGQPNYWVWAGAILHHRPARFPNGRLYDMGHYPMLVENLSGTVSGQLVTVESELFQTTIQRLDALEGYDPSSPVAGDYRRVIRQLHLDNGVGQKAWTYLGTRRAVQGATLIESGDWLAHAAEDYARLRKWWADAWPQP